MRAVGVVVALACAACTLTRSLDYLSDGKGSDAGGAIVPVVDSGSPAVSDGGAGNPMPADVTPNAVVLAGDVYVAGKRAGHGWVGRFDVGATTLKGSVDVTDATELLAIADGGNGKLLVGGASGASAVIGSIGSDLSAPAAHAVAPGSIHQVATANGVTWAAGANGTDAYITAGDVMCGSPTSQQTVAPAVHTNIVGGANEAIAFVTFADHNVTYARYAGTDCTRSFFDGGGTANDITVVTAPDMAAMATTATTFYGAGAVSSGTGTLFIEYDRATGKRPGNGGYDAFPNQVSTFVGSAHDGDAFYVVGTVAGAESILAVGSLGAIGMSQPPRTLKIPSYSARGIDVEQTAGKSGLFLVGGADGHGYVLRCDKNNGCPPLP